jgi:hypothetical protein
MLTRFEPSQLVAEASVRLEAWKDAAIGYGNLRQAQQTLGQPGLPRALRRGPIAGSAGRENAGGRLALAAAENSAAGTRRVPWVAVPALTPRGARRRLSGGRWRP